MEERLASRVLETGDALEVIVVTAPDDARREAVEALLAHKGPEWRSHIDAALCGHTDELETRFYLGVVGGRPVANVMTTEARGVGILGHVFTVPAYRRQGICRTVFGAALEHFTARGGAVLLLGTGFESPPYWLYHSFGFRSLRGGFMRWAAPGAQRFEDAWFDTAPTRITEVRWRHLPLIALLASVPGREQLRSSAWGIAGIENLEWAGIDLMHQQAGGVPAHAVALEGANGAVLGCATSFPFRVGPQASFLPGTQAVVDCFCHPAHQDQAAALLQALPEAGGKRLLFVEADQDWKLSAAQQAGYAPEGLLRGLARCGDTACDVAVMGRGSA